MKNEKEKRSKLIDNIVEFLQKLSDVAKHKKITNERTRGVVKLDRVGLAKGPNTLANGGKVSK